MFFLCHMYVCCLPNKITIDLSFIFIIITVINLLLPVLSHLLLYYLFPFIPTASCHFYVSLIYFEIYGEGGKGDIFLILKCHGNFCN